MTEKEIKFRAWDGLTKKSQIIKSVMIWYFSLINIKVVG
ncbi:hypothetical protein HMPREF9466_00476 [Fusobacterium necrophorum subsp. funduliforme 1_1_36S]|nr:hypothetical protein HMPREF9466_00476 [Fusobacterium necrophorum subsp. funduliforme 1_1_36S]